MSKIGGKKNFGYGKQLSYAGKQAIKDRYVFGHFGSVAAHTKRWVKFAKWCNHLSIRDARKITREVVQQYANELGRQVLAGTIGAAYAQNLVSTVNVILCQMRGNAALKVSPREFVGPRSSVRTDPPIWIDMASVGGLCEQLCSKGDAEVAAMVEIARALGLRLRETCLLDVVGALREAQRSATVTISRGVKGGNNARCVPVSEYQVAVLGAAAKVQGRHPNLMGTFASYKLWISHAMYVFYRAGGCHFHDLRAAYACDRYEELTESKAPVLRHANDPRPTRERDLKAREIISRELGHYRVDVVSEYVGGRR